MDPREMNGHDVYVIKTTFASFPFYVKGVHHNKDDFFAAQYNNNPGPYVAGGVFKYEDITSVEVYRAED